MTNTLTKRHKTIIISLVIVGIIAIIVTIDKKPKDSTTAIDYKINTQSKDVPTTPEGSGESLPLKGDIEFSETLEKLYREAPYYSELPIDTDKYVIVWDFEKEKFRIRLKIPKDSAENIKNAYTTEAVNRLKELTGTLFSGYEYYILYQD